MNGKINEEVRQFLLETFGATLSDSYLANFLYNTEEVYSKITNPHRWWDDVFTVVKIGDRFIGYTWAHSTGDTSVDDLGWEFDLSSICFCEPYEVTETKYRKVE